MKHPITFGICERCTGYQTGNCEYRENLIKVHDFILNNLLNKPEAGTVFINIACAYYNEKERIKFDSY